MCEVQAIYKFHIPLCRGQDRSYHYSNSNPRFFKVMEGNLEPESTLKSHFALFKFIIQESFHFKNHKLYKSNPQEAVKAFGAHW